MCECSVADRNDTDIVKDALECRIDDFTLLCNSSSVVEIDGVTDDGNIKVINHTNKEAYEVSVETIIRTPLKDVMRALETGVHVRLFGVTRIVGYYSRVANWNKSKIGELKDRHAGSYKLKDIKQSPEESSCGDSCKI